MSGEFEFVSIMGTQIMGTLQPFMALVREQGPTAAKVFYTSKTQTLAEKARKFIEEKGLGSCEISPVSTTLTGDNAAPIVLEKVAAELTREGKRICFNTDGGMNFLLAACVMALEKYKPAFITAMEDRIALYEMDHNGAGEVFRILEMPEGLKIDEFLSLQGVKFEVDKSGKTSPLNTLLREKKIKRPANSLENVTISDFEFDLIWNLPNNRLCVLKDLRVRPDTLKQEIIERERKYGRWSKDRQLCGQIFDKNVYALVDGFESAERVESASQKKIRTVEKADIHNPRYGLSAILGSSFTKIGKMLLKEPAPTQLLPMRDGTLVCSVGTNLESTLLCLQTHKPRHLLLCYTKGQEPVATYARRIKECAKEFGLESVTLAPVALDGAFLEKCLPEAEPGAHIMVNITPGTKPQTVMLTLWALKNGYALYSIYNLENKAVLLAGEGEEPTTELCPGGLYWKILDKRIGKSQCGIDELEKKESWMGPLAEFMLAADKAGKAALLMDSSIPYLKIGSDELISLGYGKWKLHKNGKTWKFKGTKGSWFEKLCAYAMKREGIKHVTLNLKELWSEKSEKKFRDYMAKRDKGIAPSEEMHKLEVDVVGSLNNSYVLLSCKSDPQKAQSQEQIDKTINAAALEAKSTAFNFGRFAHAILAHRTHPKDIDPSLARVIDWRVICEPGKLRAVLEELRDSKSQTR